jgi:hypothetical protein
MGKWNRDTAGRELHRAGLLAGGLGKAGDHSVPPEESGEGYRGLTFMMLDAGIVAVQSGQGVACAESGEATAKMEREAIEERDWL